MNLKKSLGRVAAAFLATAMLASVTAIPASAEDGAYTGITGGTQYADGNALENLTFKKTLRLPENVPLPDVDFGFTLAGTTAEEGEEVRGLRNNGSTNTSVTVYSGTSTVTGTASFTGAEEVTAVEEMPGVVQAEVTVNIPLAGLADDFDEVGAYKYLLSEDELTVNNAYDDYILDAEDRVVYLYVERASGEPSDEAYNTFVITGAVLMDPGVEYNGNSGKSNGVITNKYQLNEEGDVVPNELTLEKKVTGKMSSINDDFVFEITIDQQYSGDDRNDPANTGKSYKFVYEKWDEATGAYVVDTTKGNNGEEIVSSTKVNDKYTWRWQAVKEVTLKHNERVHIYGLSDDQQIDIVESQAAGKGKAGVYTPSYTVDGGESKKDNHCIVHFADEDVAVSYLNTRDAVSPTGLAMDIAPYALLVVVAAAGCFVFLRKRRED